MFSIGSVMKSNRFGIGIKRLVRVGKKESHFLRLFFMYVKDTLFESSFIENHNLPCILF
ncbi:hypothetical protein bcere0022_16130 [Bacillus cereus Rock3-44]|nr:hypothetical protein bcere0022_16130 [Bacillus cereus Rock3-44]